VFAASTGMVEIHCQDVFGGPTDAIPTLSWWWGLSAPETLRALPAVA
jgi:hypothetical protein